MNFNNLPARRAMCLASTVPSLLEKDDSFHCSRRIKTRLLVFRLPRDRECIDGGCIECKDGSSLPDNDSKSYPVADLGFSLRAITLLVVLR